MTAVFEGQRLRATLNAGQGARLFVTFDFRKDGRSGFSRAPRAGRLAARGWGHLHVSTTCNDWFLNDETEVMAVALAPVCKTATEVCLLGYSMGAYGALRFAAALRATRVVAVSPFVSLRPQIAPWETRHQTDLIHWDMGRSDLESRALPLLQGLIVVDPTLRADAAHAAAAGALFPGLKQVSLPGGGHPATRALREAGDNDSILAAALGEDPDGASLAQVHARLAPCAGSA